MITLYEVQTFYGSHRKNFQRRFNAISYAKKLSQVLDLEPDLIEITPFEVDRTEFCYTPIED